MRFEHEHEPSNLSSLDYSLTEDFSFVDRNTSKMLRNNLSLETENLPISRRLVFPYEKKPKKIKKILRTSLSKCQNSSLPHHYYPKIKWPLRKRWDEIIKQVLKKSRSRSRSRSKKSNRNPSRSSAKFIYEFD